MNTQKRLWTAAIAAVVAGLWTAGTAEAANPARLNINVTINANLSVEINGAASSTHSLTWNTGTPNQAFANDASSITVRNDSGAQTERWALSAQGASINQAGNPENWSLASSSTSVGADQYSVQAVFGSSNTAVTGCPAAGSANWNEGYSALLTTSNQTYTSSLFANPNLNNAGGTPNPDIAGNGRMFANSLRALCWRVIMPNSTSTADQQNLQVAITALNP